MSEFAKDVLRLKALYVSLLEMQLQVRSFEERFHVLDLCFPLEQVLREEYQPSAQGHYSYCFFVNKNGIRHSPLVEVEAQLATKIKEQGALSSDEKVAALRLLRKLAP